MGKKFSNQAIGIRVTGILPGRVVGSPDEMKQIFRAASLSAEAEPVIAKARAQTGLLYLLLLLALLLTAVSGLSSLGEQADVGDVARAPSGGKAKYLETDVEAGYGGASVKKRTSIAVRAQPMTAEEAEAAMRVILKRLPKSIRGENASIRAVTSDLTLPGEDGDSGAEIAWESDREEVISSEGNVNFIAGKPGDEVLLTAHIRLADILETLRIRVRLGVPPKEHDFTRDLEGKLDALIGSLNMSTEGRALKLPERTEDGVSLIWRTPADRSVLFALALLAVFGLFIYRGRYSVVRKAVRELREGMKRDFPDFIAKLLLMLNAGLVVTSAVARIADDYRQRRRKGEERHFYEELLAMDTRMRAAGTSLVAEFADMAVRSGQREIMRFSSILSDNIDKGSALADKLAQEEQALRLLRRKAAEEHAHIAETKLTFPMALELLAVIFITAAPAVMQMGA
ncbi:MAG: hypothetical protein LBD12_02190 [Clostridiales Family XIII bacterium]|jgi:hypothetical protein|nr:hypothetical protein [Clostridiales Family XIII bacterium]